MNWNPPAFLASNYSADRAKREALTWTRADGHTCQACGGDVLTGSLDNDAQLNACTDCPATMPPTCAATELAREWRAQG